MTAENAPTSAPTVIAERSTSTLSQGLRPARQQNLFDDSESHGSSASNYCAGTEHHFAAAEASMKVTMLLLVVVAVFAAMGQ
jgi:hypothetical protein